MVSGISKWVYRHTPWGVCPWNVKFARELEEPAFAARAATDEAGEGRGAKANSAVVLGNVGAAADVPALERAREPS